MEEFSFPRYLAAKKSVDDRALNAGVWQALMDALAKMQGMQPVTILDVGAGTGAMLRRMLERGLSGRVDYLGIDQLAHNMAAAREETLAWAAASGLPCEKKGECLRIHSPGGRVDVWFQQADLFSFLRTWGGRREWDLLTAHAFLDLVDVPETLPRLAELVAPGGLLSLTANFDGVTTLEPPVDVELDARIERLYHASMDERVVAGRRSGDSRTGRRLFGWLRAAGLEVLEAGGADWVVFSRQGRYLQDEAYFLAYILHFHAETLAGHPELSSGEMEGWLAARREQIERGEMVYIAHQLDFLARRPAE